MVSAGTTLPCRFALFRYVTVQYEISPEGSRTLGVRDVAITSAAGGLPVHCRDVCGNLGHILYTLAACCDLNAPMYMPDITSLLLHLFAVMVDPRSCDIGEALKHCVYRLLDAAGRRKVEDTVIVDCVMSPNLSSSVANRAYILSEMPNSEYGSRIARHGALRVLHQVFIGNAVSHRARMLGRDCVSDSQRADALPISPPNVCHRVHASDGEGTRSVPSMSR